MSKNAYYFSHDSNASRDPKVLQMRSIYKAEGYGWYWMLIEQMREQPSYKLPLHGKYAVNAYALQMDADAERLQEFINDCVSEFQLFSKDDNFLWSESLLRRMEFMDIKSNKARQSALERWGKTNVNNANAMRTQCDSNANKRKEKKRKETILKNSKEDTRNTKKVYGEFNNVLLTEDEYQKLTERFGAADCCRRISDLSLGISSKGYKYKSHYATILSWDRLEKKRTPQPKLDCPNTPEDYGL